MNLTISSDIQQILFNTYDVQKLIFNSHVVWEKVQHDYSQDYLTFEILTDGAIPLTNYGGATSKTIQYSKNGGSWTSLSFPSTDGQSYGINGLKAGDKVRVKGSNSAYASSASKYLYFGTPSPNDAVCEFNLSGNIMSLILGDNFINIFSLTSNYTFAYLFAKNKCRSAKNLILPATTLKQHCYYSMFYGCTSLVTAPALPATTLVDACYSDMFSGCTSLTIAPELPATTLAGACYSGMFIGCTSLTTAPTLPATTLKQHCYNSMFRGCTSLTTAPLLPATTLVQYCYNSMFYGCTSLVTAPALPATTLVDGCYDSMFYGCTNLNYIKCLARNILVSGGTSNWVKNVAASGTFVKNANATWTTGDNGIPSGWTVVDDISHDYSLDYLTFEIVDDGTIGLKTNGSIGSKTLSYKINDGAWTSITTGASSGNIVYINGLVSGDKVKFKGTNNTYASSNSNYMNFEGGTATFNIYGNIMSLVGGDNFTNTTSLTGTYNFCSLFKLSNCLSAENLILPVLTLTTGCYRALFSKATLTVAPSILPATTLAQYVYWYMFENCPIDMAPDLPFTGSLPAYSYGNMFTGCSRLKYIKCLATNISASSCTTNWVKNVPSGGIFIKNASMNSWSTGTGGIPSGWTVQNA